MFKTNGSFYSKILNNIQKNEQTNICPFLGKNMVSQFWGKFYDLHHYGKNRISNFGSLYLYSLFGKGHLFLGNPEK